MATNDEAESTLGGSTGQLQRFGRIALASAAAVSTMKRNGYFRRTMKSDEKPIGILHGNDEDFQRAIILAGIRDAPMTRARNNEDLRKQAEARRLREEMAKEKNI